VIRVQQENFDTGAEIRALTEGRTDIGAVVTFTGLVRGSSDKGGLKAMTLEHYPGMTESKLEEIEAEALRRWDLTASLIVHRVGQLEPGEQIVLVVTTSSHRQDAFEAASFLMDWLKTQAPFWKLEETKEGKSWVEAKASDDTAKDKW
jgi:molybdopterin synthase catalytic subunit